jgi:hypothetical protein
MPKKSQKFKKSGIAPLVETDPLELTHKRLNPEEAVCREREDLLKQASKFRIHGQDELEQADRSGGERLAANELIRRLKKCNKDIHFRDGIKDNVALYVEKTIEEILESDYISTDPNDHFFRFHKYVGGFPLHDMPEWGHVTVDTSNVAHREVRGWRSVLIGLIKQGAITYEAAIKEFGSPDFDSRATFWFQHLRKYRKC